MRSAGQGTPLAGWRLSPRLGSEEASPVPPVRSCSRPQWRLSLAHIPQYPQPHPAPSPGAARSLLVGPLLPEDYTQRNQA